MTEEMTKHIVNMLNWVFGGCSRNDILSTGNCKALHNAVMRMMGSKGRRRLSSHHGGGGGIMLVHNNHI